MMLLGNIMLFEDRNQRLFILFVTKNSSTGRFVVRKSVVLYYTKHLMGFFSHFRSQVMRKGPSISRGAHDYLFIEKFFTLRIDLIV